MRIGVVIPVRNRPGLVLEALRSVRAQTLLPHRVAVVDDGSTDSTAERVEDWLAEQGAPGWSLNRTEHRGAAEARQHGLTTISDVDLVAFLDSDDLWPTDLIQRATSVFQASPDLIGASADRRTVDESNGQVRTDRLEPMVTRPWRWILRHGAGVGSCTVIRADALRSIGGYPTSHPTGHDIELITGLLKLGRWGYLPGEAVTIRRHHAAARGEADHIYRQFQDAAIRYAALYEQAISLMPPVEAQSWEVRRLMARRWISAAKSADKVGDTTGAVECLSKARQYQVMSLRTVRLKWKLRRQAARPEQTSPS